jgi:hypothetical protein
MTISRTLAGFAITVAVIAGGMDTGTARADPPLPSPGPVQPEPPPAPSWPPPPGPDWPYCPLSFIRWGDKCVPDLVVWSP